MKSRSLTLLAVALVLVAASWFSIGCGGGGGGGPTSPPNPGPPPSSISFSSDSSAGADSIYLSTGSGGGGSVLVLDVDVQSVTDLYGVSFVLEYPEDFLSFSKNSESEGSFLSDGGQEDTDLQVSERTAGEVIVGITRLGTVPGASGSGNLLSLEFTRKAAGSGRMEMVDNDALDSFGDVQLDVTWISGSVTVR